MPAGQGDSFTLTNRWKGWVELRLGGVPQDCSGYRQELSSPSLHSLCPAGDTQFLVLLRPLLTLWSWQSPHLSGSHLLPSSLLVLRSESACGMSF